MTPVIMANSGTIMPLRPHSGNRDCKTGPGWEFVQTGSDGAVVVVIAVVAVVAVVVVIAVVAVVACRSLQTHFRSCRRLTKDSRLSQKSCKKNFSTFFSRRRWIFFPRPTLFHFSVPKVSFSDVSPFVSSCSFLAPAIQWSLFCCCSLLNGRINPLDYRAYPVSTACEPPSPLPSFHASWYQTGWCQNVGSFLPIVH